MCCDIFFTPINAFLNLFKRTEYFRKIEMRLWTWYFINISMIKKKLTHSINNLIMKRRRNCASFDSLADQFLKQTIGILRFFPVKCYFTLTEVIDRFNLVVIFIAFFL